MVEETSTYYSRIARSSSIALNQWCPTRGRKGIPCGPLQIFKIKHVNIRYPYTYRAFVMVTL